MSLNLIIRCIHTISPPVCLLCNRSHSDWMNNCASHRVSASLCPACTAAAFRPAPRCKQCGLRLGPRLQAFGWTRCRHCRATPNNTRTWVAADYVPPLDTLAKSLKFHGQQALARDMGAALARVFTASEEPAGHMRHPDCLIPVPVSPGRLRERGYNQALLIARSLGDQLKIPVLHHTLLKAHETGRQADLSASQRQDNLADAFTCAGHVDGLHIGLVDDVMTTGATLAVCEQTLLASGAAEVSRWVAFRTPEKPEPIEN